MLAGGCEKVLPEIAIPQKLKWRERERDGRGRNVNYKFLLKIENPIENWNFVPFSSDVVFDEAHKKCLKAIKQTTFWIFTINMRAGVCNRKTF